MKSEGLESRPYLTEPERDELDEARDLDHGISVLLRSTRPWAGSGDSSGSCWKNDVQWPPSHPLLVLERPVMASESSTNWRDALNREHNESRQTKNVGISRK